MLQFPHVLSHILILSCLGFDGSPKACQVDEADGTTMDSIITNWTPLHQLGLACR